MLLGCQVLTNFHADWWHSYNARGFSLGPDLANAWPHVCLGLAGVAELTKRKREREREREKARERTLRFRVPLTVCSAWQSPVA